jgi:anti-anti-sigma factor
MWPAGAAIFDAHIRSWDNPEDLVVYQSVVTACWGRCSPDVSPKGVSQVSGPSPRPGAQLWSAHREGRVLRLGGEIDVANAAVVRDRVVAEVCAGVDHLDLSGVGFFGAAGIEALLDAHALVRSQGKTLRLTCLPMVVRILRVCRFTELEGLTVTTVEEPGLGGEVGAGQ